PGTPLVVRGQEEFTPTEGDLRPIRLRTTPPPADPSLRVHKLELDPRILPERGLDQRGIPPALSGPDRPVDWHLPRSQRHREREFLKWRIGFFRLHPEGPLSEPLDFRGASQDDDGPLEFRPYSAPEAPFVDEDTELQHQQEGGDDEQRG